MTRIIPQFAVESLIDTKIDSMESQIANAKRASAGDERKVQDAVRQTIATMEAVVSAMKVLRRQLGYIVPVEGAAALVVGSMDDIMPDMVLRDTVTGRYYKDMSSFTDNPRDAFIFPFVNHKELTNTQEMIPYKDAIASFANPRPFPPEVAMIEEIDAAAQRSK